MSCRRWFCVVVGAVLCLGMAASCRSAPSAPAAGRAQVVVTYPVLGAVVRLLVGDAADVVILMPNGADPHEWSPSARDIAKLSNAQLVVDNGLGLEGKLQDPLRRAAARGVRIFTVAEHVTVRKVKAGEAAAPDDPDQAVGADDPHLWTDPLTMAEWVSPLAYALLAVGVDVSDRVSAVTSELNELNAEIESRLAVIPQPHRKLVTGHESMGYYAQRYGFVLVGAVIPSVTSQADASAGALAALVKQITLAGVPAIFTEVGTPSATVEAIAGDAGVEVVSLSTHLLPADGSYRSFLLGLTDAIVRALR